MPVMCAAFRTFCAAADISLIQFPIRMKRWECTICGYIHEDDEPPERCPVCDAPRELFHLLPD